MKNHFFFYTIGIFGLTILYSSCANSEIYPPHPQVVDVYFNKDTVNAMHLNNAESFVINIDFQDGDGDIGSTEAEPESNVFVTDGRNNNFYEYTVPFDLQSPSVNKSISGTIHLSVENACCTPITGIPCLPPPNAVYNTFDSVRYSVYIKDRSGNVSNSFTSQPLYLLCVN